MVVFLFTASLGGLERDVKVDSWGKTVVLSMSGANGIDEIEG